MPSERRLGLAHSRFCKRTPACSECGKDSRAVQRKFAQAPQSRREAVASPNERQRRERLPARPMRCFVQRVARLTADLVMSERSERIGRRSGAEARAGVFGNAFGRALTAQFPSLPASWLLP